jgi:hypothetical protein
MTKTFDEQYPSPHFTVEDEPRPYREPRIDTHPPFGWVSDAERLRNETANDFPGNLEEKLDGLASTAAAAGEKFNRAETRRILTGQQVGRKNVHVDKRGLAHKTKKAMTEANVRYQKEPRSYYGIGAGGYSMAAPYEPTSSYSFEDAYREAQVEIAAQERQERLARAFESATMVRRAYELDTPPPFVFVSFGISRPWYSRWARKVASFLDRI